eukprot:XP_011520613.1 uncharacterized protein LOC105369201 isoform X2 [Homo sapiens]
MPYIKAALPPQTASALRCIVPMTSYTPPLSDELGHGAPPWHSWALLALLMSLPAFLRLLGSHCPVQELFADAQPRLPKLPREVVSVHSHCFQTSRANWGGEAKPRESSKRPSLQHRPPAAGVGSWVAGGQLVPALLDMSRVGAEARVALIHNEAPGRGSRGPRSLEEDRGWIIHLKDLGSFWKWLRLEECCHTYQISLRVSLPPPLHILKNQGATGTWSLKSRGAQEGQHDSRARKEPLRGTSRVLPE